MRKIKFQISKDDQNVPADFKKDLDVLISKFKSESVTYTVDDQLTIDYWSSYYHMSDMPEVEVKKPKILSDQVSFPSIVEDLFGDPVNIDDLEYHHDRVYGISINENIFGFIIRHASDDEIQAYLDDDQYVIKEQLILKSKSEYFIELISLILKIEFYKKYGKKSEDLYNAAKIENKTNYKITFDNPNRSQFGDYCTITDNANGEEVFWEEIYNYDLEEIESFDINEFIDGQILEIPKLSYMIELDNGVKLLFTITNVRLKVEDPYSDPTWMEVKNSKGFYSSLFPTITEMK